MTTPRCATSGADVHRLGGSEGNGEHGKACKCRRHAPTLQPLAPYIGTVPIRY